MKYKISSILFIAALCSACSIEKPQETFATRARAQGAQYHKIAQDWEKGSDLITQGKNLVSKGKAQTSKGRDLIDTGEENIENGRDMIDQGQSLKTDAENYLK